MTDPRGITHHTPTPEERADIAARFGSVDDARAASWAVPFGGWAKNPWEGGWHAEDGQQCWRCRSRFNLVHDEHGDLVCVDGCVG